MGMMTNQNSICRLLLACFALLLIAPASAFADLATSYVSWKNFEIKFEFDDSFSTVPAVAGGVDHYAATISVYRIKGEKRKLIGTPFKGEFTYGKCWEDKPKRLVMMAKELKKSEQQKEGASTGILELKKLSVSPISFSP